MSLPDIKGLKKLAKACREAGIKSYKSGEFEFTLTDDAPVVKSKATSETQSPYATNDNAFVSDSLNEEQLLMWSILDPSSESKPDDEISA